MLNMKMQNLNRYMNGFVIGMMCEYLYRVGYNPWTVFALAIFSMVSAIDLLKLYYGK
jgi:hypothetical protein